jgi:hypothetical protein
MFVDYVTRGVKAGVVAGLVFGVFLALVANPMIGFAEELGHGAGDAAAAHGHGATEGHGHEAAAVSHGLTEAVSALSGVLWGVLLGAVVFGAGFYLLEPILPGSGGTGSYALALVGFVAVSGAPWLALPPRPPGAEGSLPPETRIALYAGMMVAGAVAGLLALFAYDRLHDARGRAVALAAATATLAVPVVLAPTAGTGGELPSELAAGVTGLIVFGQALLWLLLAAVHARLHAGHQRTTAGTPVAAD